MRPDASTVAGLLARRRDELAGVDVLVSDRGSLTYAQLDEASADVARRLIAGGAGKGHRVGLLMPNGLDWATAAFGIVRTGATLVPLSTLLRPPELHQQLQVAAVTELVLARAHRDRQYLDDLESIAPGIAALAPSARHPQLPFLRRVWPWDALPHERCSAELLAATERAIKPADDLAVMFTSGSRSTPKGIVHTHGNALRRATASGLESRRVLRSERLYIPMPFFWMGGFGGGLLSVLVAGATLLTESTPDPPATLAFLARERATLFRGWPDQAARIAADPAFATTDLSRLGPGSLPAILPAEQRPAPGMRANLFGMTESFGPYCGARLDRDLPIDKKGSCGRPFDGIDVLVVDVDTRRPVDAGTSGEILLRGPNMLRAICGRPRSEVFDPAGYYATGDLGRLDADGYLWYEGRRDDMFKVKGATVYPTEVEAALRSVAGVAHAFATNVPIDGTDVVGAIVVTRDDGTPEQLGQLQADARARLSSFKVPALWIVTNDQDLVPMTATGKVDKAGLQQLLREHGSMRGTT